MTAKLRPISEQAKEYVTRLRLGEVPEVWGSAADKWATQYFRFAGETRAFGKSSGGSFSIWRGLVPRGLSLNLSAPFDRFDLEYLLKLLDAKAK
jgi:hypothetical protein